VGVAVLAPAVLLAPLAVAGDVHQFVRSPWLIALDVAVGLAFPAAAVLSRGSRWWLAAVGWAWLVASFVPAAGSVHQGLLILALLAPSGRLTRWLFTGAALVVALGVLPQPVVAAVFAVLAVFAVPRLAALAVALVLFSGRLAPDFALPAYEVTLIAVAASVPIAQRARARLADRILHPEMVGLEGLRQALADALSDPTVTIDLAESTERRPDGLRVDDEDGRPIAYVRHSSPALQDPRAVADVASAVRLVLTHTRLRQEQDDLLRRQVEAQARLVAAADRQREQIAADLKQRVEAPLAEAGAALARARSDARNQDASASLDIVAQELDKALAEIAALVWAVPQTELGGGRLGDALRSLAATSPIPVTVTVTTTAAREIETALFYVCCEALANAVKHADASQVRIEVTSQDGTTTAVVTDNGHGGADPSGSGLQGLADRLAPIGGRLQIDSREGAGTTITAAIR